MGRNFFSYYVMPGIRPDMIERKSTVSFVETIGEVSFAAVVALRLPLKGERGYQCDPQHALRADVRAMLADWGGSDGAPGWEATGVEENDEHKYHLTVVAAFQLRLPDSAPAVDRPSTATQDFLLDGLRAKQAKGKSDDGPDLAAARRACGYTDRTDLPWPVDHVLRSFMQGYSDNVRDALTPVLVAMQPLEELGGIDGADYIVTMEAIANEARRRADAYRASMKRADAIESAGKPPAWGHRKVGVSIALVLDGDTEDAASAVQDLLDRGTIRDALSERDMTIVSATAREVDL